MDANDLKVLIVHASPERASSIGQVLGKHPQVSGVFSINRIGDVFTAIRQNRCNLVLTDYSLSGPEPGLPEKSKALFPNVKLALLAGQTDHPFFDRMSRTGYDGIVYEPALIRVFPAMVSSLAVDEKYYSPEFVAHSGDTAVHGLKDGSPPKVKMDYFNQYEQAPEMHLSVDPKDGMVLECDPALLDKTGYHKNELIGRPVFKLYNQDNRLQLQETANKSRATGQPERVQLDLMTKSGKPIPVMLRIEDFRSSQGKLLYSKHSLFVLSNRQTGKNRVTGNSDAASIKGKARLTSREFEVYSLLGQGHDVRQIAADLSLSLRTVRQHRKNLKRKLAIAGLLDKMD